ncbi:TetR/AcrR family transcriptional regulator [Mycolicibacterium wolinskyi]|uniref:TetR family transcriptional regulator n=1 Tax=Mycolicibacterium wolinskyi TaxID=59750 RepID=A0A1X2EZZ4_9MYCO|nr:MULTISPECIES: TetR/AcrR family transcriptional regulator [Mycolicibacterium]MCV7285174.1 TetR/AcrR family transcriptional regulator [Mycolicibacterium wolinskyi]MCV7292298.1 TetR/AcrR family transcriptional regulator [Mycolicibacterium goodii]ORX11319.1 TetR family transcriptional regulator [Mycolicibacterium wolinskyi]
MSKSWPSRRGTPPTVRKGDLREQQILDAAETLLTTRGYVHMTVGDIAEAAGITRSTLYFYFASKQDILIALVARTVSALQQDSVSALSRAAPIHEVIEAALEHTARQWREHGVVMRAAVDFASTIPEVDRLWTDTAYAISEAVTALLVRGGVPLGDGPDDARALARVLCWMVERSFYQASRISAHELDRTRKSCQSAWLRFVTPA